MAQTYQRLILSHCGPRPLLFQLFELLFERGKARHELAIVLVAGRMFLNQVPGYICIVDRSPRGADNANSPLQPTLAAAGVLSGLGVSMRPNALRIIFGLLLGALAGFFIGALPLMGLPKAIDQSSTFALRFSPALLGITH